MIGMKVGYKQVFEIRNFQGGGAEQIRGGGASNHAGATINQVGRPVDHDRYGRAKPVGIRVRRPGA